MEEESQETPVATKSFIQIPTGPFYTVVVIVMSSGIAFWNSTKSDIGIIKDRIETIKDDKGRYETKFDKLYLNYFELNDKITQVKEVVDELKNSKK